MSKIAIHSDSDCSATSVSNIFIDEYMSDANGEFVKRLMECEIDE